MFAAVVLMALLGNPVALPLEAWAAEPVFEMRDAYKWIFQATQGGEHAAPSEGAAAEWLRQEWASVGTPGTDEPMIEPLGASGLVRLNLRPFKAAGGDRQALLAAFLASAHGFSPDRAAFERGWQSLGEELRRGDVGRLSRRAWEQLDGEMGPRGYPAVHHGEAYTAARHPAYRVLTDTRARQLVAALRASR
jgi:hypothetical protein